MSKIFVNAIPKAGTNLLAKFFQICGLTEKGHIGSNIVLGKRNNIVRTLSNALIKKNKNGYIIGIDMPVEVPRVKIDRMINELKNAEFITGHVGYTTDLMVKLNSLDIKSIIVIRDPRAVLSSFVNYVENNTLHPIHKYFVNLTMAEKYTQALQGGQFGEIFLQPLSVRYNSIIPWLYNGSNLVVKFEDLVGAKGGGDDILQESVIYEIINYANIDNSKLDNIKAGLFGSGRGTFRKGKIDSWKDEIPDDILNKVYISMQTFLKEWYLN